MIILVLMYLIGSNHIRVILLFVKGIHGLVAVLILLRRFSLTLLLSFIAVSMLIIMIFMPGLCVFDDFVPR